jgi:chromosomal replication initiation ATPase DnaA
MQQLILDLAPPPRFGREDYLVSSSNAAALAAIERWPDWPDRVLILTGPQGAGKSHLAAVWAAAAQARILTPQTLAPAEVPALLDRPNVLEDADQVIACETQLFHLLNLVRNEKSFLLLTARRPPGNWGLKTADLLSRLRLAPLVTIEKPDDDLLRAVLVKLFTDRQLIVDETVVAYLVLQLDRSFDAARTMVDRLDRAALSLNRKVTRAMAAKLLERAGPEAD